MKFTATTLSLLAAISAGTELTRTQSGRYSYPATHHQQYGGGWVDPSAPTYNFSRNYARPQYSPFAYDLDPTVYINPWNQADTGLARRVAALEAVTILDAGYVVNTSALDFPSSGEITLGEFCAEGPAVLEVYAQVTLIKSDIENNVIRLSVGGVANKVLARTKDADKEDTFGIYWIGPIEEDADVVITIEGPSSENNAIRSKSAYVSYKLYAPGFPVQSELPAPCDSGI